MRKFPIGPRTGELAVWRNVFLVVCAPEEGHYGFMPCDKEHKQNQDNITFDPGFLFPNDAFTRLAHAMADAMGGLHCFDYIHVRRGDKLDARRWPHLDRGTRPKASSHRSSLRTALSISQPMSHTPTPPNSCLSPLPPASPVLPSLLQKLPSLVPPNSTLYIATNEPHPHFFDPLKAAYSVYIQEDFESLWAKGLAWEAEMREVAASVGVAVGERVEFDSEMQVLVDYALKKLARRMVETFNDLTDDPKDAGVVDP
ncbi:unnamed protein product [Closterium sp. Naga37s-1]|nr:unnamed protein product [Closterium sp. Naga37s-1]